MKIKTHATIAFIALSSTIASAQSSSTNIVHVPPSFTNTADCVLKTSFYGEVGGAMFGISRAFGIRIGVEDHTERKYPTNPMSFTNATLEHVLTSVMSVHTNYVWRYDSRTDGIVVRPSENSLSARHYDRISVTNMSLERFFNTDDILGCPEMETCFYLGKGLINWDAEKEISLEMEDVTMAEVLNAVCLQLSPHASWVMFKPKPDHFALVFLRFSP